MWRGDDDEEDHHESTRVGSAVGDAIVKTSERTGQEPKCCVGHGCPAAAAVDMVADIAGSRAPSLTLTAARESVDRVSGSDVRWSSLQHPDPLESVGRKVQDLIFYFFWVSCRCVNTRRDPGSSYWVSCRCVNTRRDPGSSQCSAAVRASRHPCPVSQKP